MNSSSSRSGTNVSCLRSSRRRMLLSFSTTPRAEIGIEANQRRNGIQRVEQEVRIDLAGERVHARLQQQLLVLLEIHLDARVVPDFQRRRDGHHRGEHRSTSHQFQCGSMANSHFGLVASTSATRPSSRPTQASNGNNSHDIFARGAASRTKVARNIQKM